VFIGAGLQLCRDAAHLLPAMLLSNFSEETAWRGVLPVLLQGAAWSRRVLAIGLLWWVWHIPGDLWCAPERALARAIPLLPLLPLLLAASVVLLWLRQREGAIWSSVLVHLSLNLTAGVTLRLFARSSLDAQQSDLLLRAAAAVAFSLLAVILWRRFPLREPARRPADR
jgi:membrane protease YdiL (CAAX protease family)